MASSRIPVSFVTEIDHDHSSEGYSVSKQDSLTLCYPLLSPGSHNEPVKGMICGWEGAVNPQ